MDVSKAVGVVRSFVSDLTRLEIDVDNGQPKSILASTRKLLDSLPEMREALNVVIEAAEKGDKPGKSLESSIEDDIHGCGFLIKDGRLCQCEVYQTCVVCRPS